VWENCWREQVWVIIKRAETVNRKWRGRERRERAEFEGK